jgi:hypothetical protein
VIFFFFILEKKKKKKKKKKIINFIKKNKTKLRLSLDEKIKNKKILTSYMGTLNPVGFSKKSFLLKS